MVLVFSALRAREVLEFGGCGVYVVYCFFFFQAEDGIRDYKVTGVQTCVFLQEEDGIRDYKVTGVQTCALPICSARRAGGGRREAGDLQERLDLVGRCCASR